jgi:hypothetical protein
LTRRSARVRAGTWSELVSFQETHSVDVFRATARQRPDGLFEIVGLLTDGEIAELPTKGLRVDRVANVDEITGERSRGTGLPGSPCSTGRT